MKCLIYNGANQFWIFKNLFFSIVFLFFVAEATMDEIDRMNSECKRANYKSTFGIFSMVHLPKLQFICGATMAAVLAHKYVLFRIWSWFFRKILANILRSIRLFKTIIQKYFIVFGAIWDQTTLYWNLTYFLSRNDKFIKHSCVLFFAF